MTITEKKKMDEWHDRRGKTPGITNNPSPDVDMLVLTAEGIAAVQLAIETARKDMQAYREVPVDHPEWQKLRQ